MSKGLIYLTIFAIIVGACFAKHHMTLRKTSHKQSGWVDIYAGVWGDWKGQKRAPPGYYACGAQFRIENGCGSCDDTAGNGLRLKWCSYANWNSQIDGEIVGGIWGGWTEWRMCPYEWYIAGGQVRFEDPCGSCDDTALNGLNIFCRNPKTGAQQWITVHGGIWGGWKNQIVSPNYVNGGEARFENEQGGGDDSALNGIRFHFQEIGYGTSKQVPVGYWEFVASGATISTTIEDSVTTSTSQSMTKEFSYGFSQSISAGFEFKIFSASATVTSNQSWSVAETVSSTLERGRTVSYTVTCGDRPENVHTWYMYRWRMVQRADYNGEGFNLQTSHVVCTDSPQRPPKCVLGFCNDQLCQTCHN